MYTATLFDVRSASGIEQIASADRLDELVEEVLDCAWESDPADLLGQMVIFACDRQGTQYIAATLNYVDTDGDYPVARITHLYRAIPRVETYRRVPGGASYRAELV